MKGSPPPSPFRTEEDYWDFTDVTLACVVDESVPLSCPDQTGNTKQWNPSNREQHGEGSLTRHYQLPKRIILKITSSSIALLTMCIS